MKDNTVNLVIAGLAALTLAAGALVVTLIIGNNTPTGLAPAEILSGGIFGAAFLVFSPRHGAKAAVFTVAMVAGALALYVGGLTVIIGGTLATAAWIVSLWLIVATADAYLRTNQKSG